MNKASAMAVLQSRLDQLEMVRQAQINAEHTQSLTDINFGSQIRSYVLHVCISFRFHLVSFCFNVLFQGDDRDGLVFDCSRTEW